MACGKKCLCKKCEVYSAYKGTNRVKAPAPYILHTGERVLNRRQTEALDRLEKLGKVKLPKGSLVPQKLKKVEVKRILSMMVNGTKRGRKNKK
jgi:hypothetical protein